MGLRDGLATVELQCVSSMGNAIDCYRSSEFEDARSFTLLLTFLPFNVSKPILNLAMFSFSMLPCANPVPKSVPKRTLCRYLKSS
jgi:hypothetical protein